MVYRSADVLISDALLIPRCSAFCPGVRPDIARQGSGRLRPSSGGYQGRLAQTAQVVASGRHHLREAVPEQGELAAHSAVPISR